MVISTQTQLTPFEVLFDESPPPDFDLPGELAEAYGGPFGLTTPRLYANFVSSLDGVVAIRGELQSSHLIAAASEADRFVMGLLRASPRTRWTAEHAYAPAADLYAELRRQHGRPPQPTLAIVRGSGLIDQVHPGLSERSLVLTSQQEARQLGRRLPHSATIVPIGDAPLLEPAATVKVLRARGHELILCEGGPTLFAGLAAAEVTHG
jgi:riboflavin biosynthesis pyrimidine reductase